MNDLNKSPCSGRNLCLYNTLSGKVEPVIPLNNNNEITMYSCGPTVYDLAHIGNFRTFLVSDLLRRTLEFTGINVIQVMNITDVGHLTDDHEVDSNGLDKMESAAKRILESKKQGTLPENLNIDHNDPYAIADFYTKAFINDAKILGLKIANEYDKNPRCMPRATEMISEIIESISTLLKKEHAYIGMDGAVYYSVESFKNYGQLSKNTISELKSGQGGRVDMNTQSIKKHPSDFLLWKPDKSHIMKWESPWGIGYPGWHIECTAIALNTLASENKVIDIHTGGEDLIFPHHECEIAQSCGLTGKKYFAKLWCHTRHLFVNGEKMSKSKNNFFTLTDLLKRGATPASIRLALLQTHYRSNANFTWQNLKDAASQIRKWNEHKTKLVNASLGENTSIQEGPIAKAFPKFINFLLDDLNISGALGILNTSLNQIIPENPSIALGELITLDKINSIIGAYDLKEVLLKNSDRKTIESLIKKRNNARKEKDFQAADNARLELESMGIKLKDGPEGTTWERFFKL